MIPTTSTAMDADRPARSVWRRGSVLSRTRVLGAALLVCSLAACGEDTVDYSAWGDVAIESTEAAASDSELCSKLAESFLSDGAYSRWSQGEISNEDLALVVESQAAPAARIAGSARTLSLQQAGLTLSSLQYQFARSLRQGAVDSAIELVDDLVTAGASLDLECLSAGTSSGETADRGSEPDAALCSSLMDTFRAGNADTEAWAEDLISDEQFVLSLRRRAEAVLSAALSAERSEVTSEAMSVSLALEALATSISDYEPGSVILERGSEVGVTQLRVAILCNPAAPAVSDPWSSAPELIPTSSSEVELGQLTTVPSVMTTVQSGVTSSQVPTPSSQPPTTSSPTSSPSTTASPVVTTSSLPPRSLIVESESFSPGAVTLPAQLNVYVTVTLSDSTGALPTTIGSRLCPPGAANLDTPYCTGTTMYRNGSGYQASYSGLYVLSSAAPTGSWFAYYFWPVGMAATDVLKGSRTVQVSRA